MRPILLLVLAGSLAAEPLRWADLPAAIQALLAEAALPESAYPDWRARHLEESKARLNEGAAEHIAYFVLQSKTLSASPPLDPAKEARRYFESLPEPSRREFLRGGAVHAPLSPAVQIRIEAFWRKPPDGERHRILRSMADGLAWPPERIVQAGFRFLIRRSETGDADGLYQQRGLSADPYPPSMRAIARGIAWLEENRPAPPRADVLLAGPGAELGSRFGIDDAAPVRSPQPDALLSLLGKTPASFVCADIRPEVTETLRGSPCRPIILDLAADRLPVAAFDLAVATNVLVYLDDRQLALAFANLAAALRPGGCLLHNDSRFAARLFGDAAGIPAGHFESVTLEQRNGRDQLDRVAVHCKPATGR